MTAQATSAASNSRRNALAALILAVAVVAAYANSLGGAFIFDDIQSIPGNASIRHLWPISDVLVPAPGSGATVEGRPLLNLSYALNYAAGGTHVAGYHLANLAIHILAALSLLGIVRRTLKAAGGPLSDDALAVALACALLWALHPMQTESVSYLSQRAESLMGLLFLACLYAAIRSSSSPRPAGWMSLSVALAVLCACAKEVSVALPVVVLLYDRAFLSGSFAGALRRRKPLYAGLLASWCVLAYNVWTGGDRGGTIGARAGISHWQFALCQARGIFHYIRLCFWPHPLIADYGTNFVTFGQALPWGLLLAGLVAVTVWAQVRRPRIGFIGAWFFVILAPSSSFVGGTRQMLAEHRMYLSLAAVVVGAVLAAYRLLGRRSLAIWGVVAAIFAAATASRNAVYHDSLSLDEDIVLHRPANAWAQNNLAVALGDAGRTDEALRHLEAAVAQRPDYAEAHNNLANLLATQPGRQSEAARHYEEALRLRPDYAEAENNLGNLLARQPGARAEAIRHYEAALRLRPGFADAENNLANLLAADPASLDEAIVHYRGALRSDPDLAVAHNNLGRLLAAEGGHEDEALSELESAVQLDPGYAAAHNNLGLLMASRPGGLEAAAGQFEAAARLQPGSYLFQFNLGRTLAALPGREKEGEEHLAEALRLNPHFLPADRELERLRAGGGR